MRICITVNYPEKRSRHFRQNCGLPPPEEYETMLCHQHCQSLYVIAIIITVYILQQSVLFLQRVHIADNAERCNSQRDSVCLSVSLSRSAIVSRRMKIRSCSFQRLVGQSF